MLLIIEAADTYSYHSALKGYASFASVIVWTHKM
jgi:hypothetical protein